MKKYIKLALFTIAAFIIIPQTSAKIFSENEIPNGTYIIGNYMFTREANEESKYYGQLTTQHIMLAAKSIESNSLDGMLILYKNPRGKWIDGMSGNEISITNSFNITSKNNSIISYKLEFNIWPNISYVDYYNIGKDKKVEIPNLPVAEVHNSPYYFLGWKYNNNKIIRDLTINLDMLDIISQNNKFTAEWTILGDVSGNNLIDENDTYYLKKYLDGENIEINKTNSDVNLDGKINEEDYLLIKAYLSDNLHNISFPYTKDKYTITYNLNGGILPKKLENYYNDILPYTLPTPIKDGYYFVGWTGNDSLNLEKNKVIEKNTSGNLNFIAHWALLGDVTGDGEINGIDLLRLRKYVETDEEVVINYLNSDLNGDNIVNYEDVMLLKKYNAGWNICFPFIASTKYNIHYELFGGTLKYKLDYYYPSVLPYTLPNPTKDGYVFMGWFTRDDSNPKKNITIDTNTTGNLTYFAKWVQLGDINADGLVDSNDISLLSKYIIDNNENIEKSVSDLNADGEINNLDLIVLQQFINNEIKTLPYDTGLSYKVNLIDINGGQIFNSPIYALGASNLNVPLPSLTSTNAYLYSGWYLNNDKNKTYFSIPKGNTKDVTFYAEYWELPNN